MSAVEGIWNVFSKEMMDNLRDRRSMFSALVSSLIGPVLIIGLIIILGRTLFQDATENPLRLPVVGAENAPSLIQFLEQNGALIDPAPENYEALVRSGELEVVLVIPDGYGEDFSAGRPATVRLVVDTSRTSALASVDRTRNLLSSYNQQIASLRLLARGVSPNIVQPMAVETLDVSTPQSQSLAFLNMLPYFIIMVIFIGGMYVIIDATAGERERGSLEPLLINPLPRWQLVVGKLAASLPFVVLAVFLTLVAFYLAFNVLPIEDYVGIQLRVDPAALAGIFLISLPLILLASALQMIIATYTRSFKEAQTYVGFLPLIPALPGIGLAFIPVKATVWTMLIPTFGQQLLINQMLRGEPVSALNLLVSTLVTILAAALLIALAIRLYQRERILFGAR